MADLTSLAVAEIQMDDDWKRILSRMKAQRGREKFGFQEMDHLGFFLRICAAICGKKL